LIDIDRIRVDIARRKYVELQLIGSIVVGVVVEFRLKKLLFLILQTMESMLCVTHRCEQKLPITSVTVDYIRQ